MRQLCAIIVVFAASCAAGQKASDRALSDPADLDAPTASELADAPCGNPDWSELPPGSDAPEESTPAEPGTE